MQTDKEFKKLLRLNRLPEFEELTLEQQAQIVKFKKNYDKIIDLPKQFCVVHTQEVASYLNKIYISGGYVKDLTLYSHFPGCGDWKQHCHKSIQSGYTKISIEQFRKYVQKNEK